MSGEVSEQGRGGAAPWERWGAWMAAAQDGDQEAYQSLLGELLPVLRSLVRLRVRDASAAEDVVQEILLALHRSRHTYRPERPFGPWLRSIARNTTIDFFRAQGRRAERALHPMDESEIAAPVENVPDGDGELGEELAHALEGLPPAQRQAVELLQLQDLSVREAATRLGITPSALKVRAHRGYRALHLRLTRKRE